VCSIDTLKARKNWPHKDKQPLIFLDESHKDYTDIFAQYQDAYFIGMTGSPFTNNSDYNAVVHPIEGFELRDQGFLVPEKIYCPHIIDVSAVKMKAGDFEKKALESVVTQSSVVGNVIQDWIDFGQNRPTVCFAVSIEHSLQLKQAFLDKGISAIHIDANSSDEERANAKRGLETGKVKIVCNVNIFSVGWNCPIASCIILARPTWSLTWYLQAIFRGFRPSNGKADCIILDNAGNVFRHGTPYRIREVSLEKSPGTLVEYFESEEARAKHLFAMMRADYYKLEWVRKTKGKSGKGLPEAWVFSQLQKKYSPEIFAQLGKITVVPKAFQVDQAEKLAL
jgi:superfamily II DNA or RNA helicase